MLLVACAPEGAAPSSPTGSGLAAGSGRPLPSPGDLIVVDADAGGELGGVTLGVLFLLRLGEDGRHGQPERLAEDDRWHEPLDVQPAPGGPHRWYVLESQHPSGPGLQRGGVFLVDLTTGRVELVWTDPGLRQPVGLARLPSGTLWVSDRSADPLGLERTTGGLFEVGLPGTAPGGVAQTLRVLGDPRLVTPAALLVKADGGVLLMDADANPHEYPGTPGVLFDFDVEAGRLVQRIAPRDTTSPVGFVERRPGEVYLIDANEGPPGDPTYADGGVFRVGDTSLEAVVTSRILGRRALHDPAQGDVLEDGRLVVADVSLDPLGLGPDGSTGFVGTGPGAIVAIDPETPEVSVLVASPLFVTPIGVKRVRP